MASCWRWRGPRRGCWLRQLLYFKKKKVKKLSSEARNRLIPFTISPFTFDRTAPHITFTISDDGTTATKIAAGHATFRASQPLTTANHKWAIKIVEDGGEPGDIILGFLPKLSDAQVAVMEGTYVGSSTLGGWGMDGHGYKYGDWESPEFIFAKGDVIVCDFNFAAKTLTLSCGDRKAVGTIPSDKEGDELYPAVSLWFKGQQVAFVAA